LASARGLASARELASERLDDARVTTQARREDALRRAAFRIEPRATFVLPPLPDFVDEESSDPLTCRFLPDEPSGTSAKFDCMLATGDVVKVKYGRNPEIPAEIAATRLLRGLGYAADDVAMVRRVRCYGCPRYPFLAMQLQSWMGGAAAWGAATTRQGYTDFEWVSVERKFPAPAIEGPDVKGWAWYELDQSAVPRGELDAFRLLAVFLAHWDNKASNQRLVCLDGAPGTADRPCQRPIAMMQDLGSTFGPVKVSLARWRDDPVWADRATCTVSMKAYPFHGATFPDVRISEDGRRQLAAALASISDGDLERLFRDARVPRFYSGTDDEADLAAWMAAFRGRADQIRAAVCPG
jgi:hypothetical protein